jgi:hypothetical protein
MTKFRVWLQPTGGRCKVRVERRANAERLQSLLRDYKGEVTALEHVQDTPLDVFHVGLSEELPLGRVREIVRSVPEAELMPVAWKIRLTIVNSKDLTEGLMYAARVRRDLWAHSPVDVDPDDPRYGTHRDSEKRPYFELITDKYDEVKRVLAEHGHSDRVLLTEVVEERGPECLNCGNVAGTVFPAVCPNCGMREISACPFCQKDVPRQLYRKVSGDLYVCPECECRVRMQTNPEPFRGDGTYNPPLFLVKRPS